MIKLFITLFFFVELFWYIMWYGQKLNDGKDLAGLIACVLFSNILYTVVILLKFIIDTNKLLYKLAYGTICIYVLYIFSIAFINSLRAADGQIATRIITPLFNSPHLTGPIVIISFIIGTWTMSILLNYFIPIRK